MKINDTVRLDIQLTGKVVAKTIERTPHFDIAVDINGRKFVLPNIPASWLEGALGKAA